MENESRFILAHPHTGAVLTGTDPAGVAKWSAANGDARVPTFSYKRGMKLVGDTNAILIPVAADKDGMVAMAAVADLVANLERPKTPPILVSLDEVTGTLAYWAVQQSPYPVPANLERVLANLAVALTPHFPDGYAEFSDGDSLEEFLHQFIFADADILAWNQRRNGNQSALSFTSAIEGDYDPDDDFIDLDAMLRNMVMTMRDRWDRLVDETDEAERRVWSIDVGHLPQEEVRTALQSMRTALSDLETEDDPFGLYQSSTLEDYFYATAKPSIEDINLTSSTMTVQVKDASDLNTYFGGYGAISSGTLGTISIDGHWSSEQLRLWAADRGIRISDDDVRAWEKRVD